MEHVVFLAWEKIENSNLFTKKPRKNSNLFTKNPRKKNPNKKNKHLNSMSFSILPPLLSFRPPLLMSTNTVEINSQSVLGHCLSFKQCCCHNRNT